MIKFIVQPKKYQVLMSFGPSNVVIKITETLREGYSTLPKLEVILIIGIIMPDIGC